MTTTPQKEDGHGTEPDEARPLPRFALPEVVGVAMSAEAIASIVQHSIEEMAKGLNFSRLVVLSYVPREGQFRGVATVGFREENVRLWKWPFSYFPAAERAVRTGQILPLATSVPLPAEFEPYLNGERAVVPLILGERPLAVLVGVLETGVSARTTAWQQRAKEVAERAALVVELERVASAYQDELRLRASNREIAAAILEGKPIAEIGATLTQTISQRLGEDRVALFLRDVQGFVWPAHLLNVSPEYGDMAARMTAHSPLVARAVATGLPYHLRDMAENPQYSPEMRALFRRENITSALLAVLQYRDEIKGAIVVYPHTDREFTPAEMTLLQAFADMATLGVAFSQLLEKQHGMAIIEERNRLAREMHDTVAQSLTGLLMQIETVQTLLDARDYEGAKELLTASRAQAKKALQDTRRAVQGLTPALLENLSPPQAIRAEVERFETEAGIPAQFVTTGEEQPLTPEQQVALLRIAQEALTNARKHAEASRIRVGLQYGSDDVILLVEDDGIGFDISTPVTPGTDSGYGLFGMNERARLIGGELNIESTPGWGTRIQAKLPYRPSSPLSLGAKLRESYLIPQPPSLAVPSSLREEGDKPAFVSSLTARNERAGEGAGGRFPTPGTRHPTPIVLRVLVADDHAVTREGVRAMLEASGEIVVVGEAEDGGQAAVLAQTLRPDVVLMDVQMPNVDGLEGLRRIRAEMPELPVVMLTTFQSDESVSEALSVGAKGYILKDAGAPEIVSAVRAASRGETRLASEVTERLAILATGQAARPQNEFFELNEREREVLELLARGARNKEIAAQLFITTKTVEYHLSNLFAKLGVSNRTEAVRVALENNLVKPMK